MPGTDKRLRPSEHLKSRKEIARLFAGKARAKHSYPLRIVWVEAAPERPWPGAIQAAFVVSKRRFKHAVDRNLLKRRMREAYRLNKHLLARPQEQSENPAAMVQPGISLMVMYVGKEEQSFRYIERKMRKVLKGMWDSDTLSPVP